MRVGTFTVPAVVRNPRHPEGGVALDLLVDTGATWTVLPAHIVTQLELPTPWQRSVTLASGDLVSYATGEVALRLNEEEVTTIFLAGPPGALGLLGAVTLEQFGVAPDPVKKSLVRVGGMLAAGR
jgi:clan AA aspartic protease